MESMKMKMLRIIFLRMDRIAAILYSPLEISNRTQMNLSSSLKRIYNKQSKLLVLLKTKIMISNIKIVSFTPRLKSTIMRMVQ